MSLNKKSFAESDNRIDPDRCVMIDGFAKAATFVQNKHPLEESERTYQQRMDALNFSTLKSVQGIQAPLKLMMERKAASNVGRLPFMHSSNLMLDVLEDREETIGPEDVFNDPSMAEAMGCPHMVVERSLGLL